MVGVKMNLSVRWKCFFEVGLILVLFSASADALTPATAPTVTAPTSTAHHGDPELQQKRLSFMKNAIALGLIIGIEENSPITCVLVGQKFMLLSAEEKEDVINVVWAYYKIEDPQKNVVLVIDQKSGMEIGEYSLANGGLKMK
jgi:hypothetical protein